QEAREVVVQRTRRVLTGSNLLLNRQYSLRQQRSELSVGQDAARGFDRTGGVAWRCRALSHASSTGCFSNAIESATCLGTRSQRAESRTDSGNWRQRRIVSSQFTED